VLPFGRHSLDWLPLVFLSKENASGRLGEEREFAQVGVQSDLSRNLSPVASLPPVSTGNYCTIFNKLCQTCTGFVIFRGNFEMAENACVTCSYFIVAVTK
jgi:hypothetical protein